MPVGEVRQQLQYVCQSLQNFVFVPKDSLWKIQASKEMTERQNLIHDKFNFLKTHNRRKGLSEWLKSLA